MPINLKSRSTSEYLSPPYRFTDPIMIALMTDWHIGIHKIFSILELDKYSELNGFLMALCV